MFNGQNSNNQAEKIITLPIRPSVTIIALALMTALSINTLIQSIYSYQDYRKYRDFTYEVISNKVDTVSETELNQSVKIETNRIIVKFKDKTKEIPELAIETERVNLEKTKNLVKVLTIDGINADVYEVSNGKSAQEVVDYILSDLSRFVEYAEVDMLVSPDFIPNDKYFLNQWHHSKVATQLAWDISQGESVTVGVLDSGVNPVADLSLSSIPVRNFYDGSSNITDVYGHGTKVAGAVAAIGNNGDGVIGISPKTLVMGIKIARDSDGYSSWSAMAQGVMYAIDNGARVVNLSYAACGSPTIMDSANYARNKGGVVVISAGNLSGYNSAILDNKAAICVSATDTEDKLTSWSSFGAYVDVAAPGVGILTTLHDGGYGAADGTSFSAPLVAGLYALIFSINPQLTRDQVDNIIFTTADDLGETGWDQYYGYGRINAAKAVSAAIEVDNIVEVTPPL